MKINLQKKYINYIIIAIIILIVIINRKTLKAEIKKLIPIKKNDFTNDVEDGAKPILSCSKLLNKGTKGPEVQQLQNYMLMADPNILPKYGADGDFGSETLAALQSLTGYSSITLAKAVLVLNEKLKPYNITIPQPC